jgi:cell division cycle 20, cofactor of APC complex
MTLLGTMNRLWLHGFQNFTDSTFFSYCYLNSVQRTNNSVVEYENLMDTTFNDANRSVQSNVVPRWERKKLQQSSNNNTTDRFIPQRSHMELAKHQLRLSTSSARSDDTTSDVSALSSEDGTLPGGNHANNSHHKSVTDQKKGVYASQLSAALLGVEDITNSRVLSYQEKAPAPSHDTISQLNVLYSAATNSRVVGSHGSNGTHLVSRHIPSAPSRILDAPDLLDDYYLNLLDWSDSNWLAIALGPTVFLWNAGTGDIEELCTFDDVGVPNAHISSVSWVQQGGTHIAVGTSNGYTQLWDVAAGKKLRSMGGHSDRVGAMAWNRHILTSGSRDANIIHHDVRIAQHEIATLSSGHQQEVCGLSWSNDGEVLASGANDNVLCLWDATRYTEPRYRCTDHQAAVKALAWSPHERHLLASGAGTADRTIKFWNSSTGALLNSIDTGSQVCALQWNPYEKEILSSHGYSRNQLSLWKYPSMTKIKDLEGHTSRVLHMACGPTGTIVSAAADETLRFWDVFAPPSKASAASSTKISLSNKQELTTLAGTRKACWTMHLR